MFLINFGAVNLSPTSLNAFDFGGLDNGCVQNLLIGSVRAVLQASMRHSLMQGDARMGYHYFFFKKYLVNNTRHFYCRFNIIFPTHHP